MKCLLSSIFSGLYPSRGDEAKHILFQLTKPLSQIGQERYKAPEVLFNPDLIGLEYPGVHQIVQDAIVRTDLDLRKSLYSNIVLSGGSTLCKNFPDRLVREIKKLAFEEMKVRISAPAERKYTTWIGGGILAGLSTFRKVGLGFPFPLLVMAC